MNIVKVGINNSQYINILLKGPLRSICPFRIYIKWLLWGEKMYTVSFGMTNNTFFVVGGHLLKEEALTVLINQKFVSEEEIICVKHCHQIDVVNDEVVRTPATMVELADSPIV